MRAAAGRVLLASAVLLLAAWPGEAAAQGGRILFYVGFGGELEPVDPGPFVMSGDGRFIQNLPFNRDLALDTDWNRSGTHYAVAYDEQLDVVGARGQNRRMVAKGPQNDLNPRSPDWSAAGDQI